MADGISSDHFSPQERHIWEWIADHRELYRENPSLSAVKTEFPDYRFEATSDSLPFLKNQFVRDLEKMKVNEALLDVAKSFDSPSFTGSYSELLFQQWQSVAMTLPQAARVNSFKDMKHRVSEYEKLKALGALPGIPMGISRIDELTMGIQATDYITVAGFTGTGKSTLTQWILLNAYLSGKTPLFISLEMESRSLMRKWDTMMTNFNYQRLKNLGLTDEEEKRWKEVADEVSKNKADIRVAGDGIQKCSTETVYGLACRYKPDIIAIDYITLMEYRKGKSMSMWEAVTELSRELKMMARSLNIPIIGVAQTNRGAADQDPTLADIAYSHSINQDSDIILALGKRDDDMRTNHQAKVLLNKNRDGATGECKLLWKMETMEFREWGGTSDMFKRKHHDEQD